MKPNHAGREKKTIQTSNTHQRTAGLCGLSRSLALALSCISIHTPHTTHLSEEVGVQVNLPEPRAGEGEKPGPLAERLEGDAENRREH